MINVRPGGRGMASDVALVRAELARFPAAELDMLAAKGTGVIVCWDSVVDHRPDLAAEHPRNWPPGHNWSAVPGCYAPDERNVIIATIAAPGGGRRVPPTGIMHGSWNLVLHETMHADDYAVDRLRCRNPSFVAARKGDLARRPPPLSEYESRSDQAGHEETYAETAARYFGGDPTMSARLPALHAFWAGATLPLEPGRSRRGAARDAPVGTATLLDDGRIELDLRAENAAGVIGHALFDIAEQDELHQLLSPRFARIRRRRGGGLVTVVIDQF